MWKNYESIKKTQYVQFLQVNLKVMKMIIFNIKEEKKITITSITYRETKKSNN